ncbi:Protein FAM24A [Lemmus lemmus]
MLDVDMNTVVGIICGMLAVSFVLTIFAFCLDLKEVKEVKCANRGDVESCIKSRKNTQEKIIRAKPITDEACPLQYSEECRIYANSGTLPPYFCGTNKGPPHG